MTVSYEAVAIPSERLAIDPVTSDIKAEPPAPIVPAAGAYGASDVRARQFGLWAVDLRAWGRGLIAAIEQREAADAVLVARSIEERQAALGRLEVLQKE